MLATLPLPKIEAIRERLRVIFAEGISDRNYLIREMAARTVFVMLYIGAIAETDRYLAPKHVYRMTDEQAAKRDAAARWDYARNIVKPGYEAPGERWYADNTREPIREETLREGLVAVGAVIARDDLPTTSSKPRYAIKAGFAALFDPILSGEALEKDIAAWQEENLSSGALARVSIMRLGAVATVAGVLVTFPNGETRKLAPGPSSVITQAVIEVFAKRFLEKPAVLWLSESGNKVVARDDDLAAAIGLEIRPDKNLPDLILADLGPTTPLLVFVEVVATDGAVTRRRQEALYALSDAAGFKRSQVAFVTAYQDRESAGFKKTVFGLAWGSFAWFVSEPGQIVILHDGGTSPTRLAELMRNG